MQNQADTSAPQRTAEPATGTRASHPEREPAPVPAAAPGETDTGAGPLFLDGWLEFNRAKWKVEPLRLSFTAPKSDRPSIEAVLYLDRHGRVYHPPRNPYMPVRFQSTETTKQHRKLRQWIEMSDLIAAETRRRGLVNTLNLAPEVADVRAWQWAGYRAAVRYALILDIPFSLRDAQMDVGNLTRKATRAGYRCARTTDMTELTACLAETEQRQDFRVGLSTADFELAARLLGEEHFRAYVCYAPNGEPASASVVLHQAGTPAIGWVKGTRTADLRAGASYLLELFTIEDLERLGVPSYDLGGANMRSIANFKSTWGARLQPYYTVEGYSVRRLAKWSLNWWEFLKTARRQR